MSGDAQPASPAISNVPMPIGNRESFFMIEPHSVKRLLSSSSALLPDMIHPDPIFSSRSLTPGHTLRSHLFLQMVPDVGDPGFAENLLGNEFGYQLAVIEHEPMPVFVPAGKILPGHRRLDVFVFSD